MIRERIVPRADWKEKAQEVGFTYYNDGDFVGSNWDESICYRFTLEEVLKLEEATAELHSMCIKAIQNFIWDNPYDPVVAISKEFNLPMAWAKLAYNSFVNHKDITIMGRFDLAYNDKTGDIKLLEYNADTPTMVIETALVQWFWLQDVHPDLDQFNSLHEKLIDRYKHLKKFIGNRTVTFSSISPNDSSEEYNHVLYFMDLASQAGINTKFCEMKDIGLDSEGYFVDQDNETIEYWSKLYPWEWLLEEEFGRNLLDDRLNVIEPPWKMLLSNKSLLPLLWKHYPNHKYLLPASYNKEDVGENYVKKPIFAREGANISYINGENSHFTSGPYDENLSIYQGMADLGVHDDQYSIICSWVAGGDPAGMIIRESDTPIITTGSKIVPHYIKD